MQTKTTFLSSALVVVLLLVVTTPGYAFNYTISFTAGGVTTSVGSVQVQNLTKGTTVTVPEGNTLTLTDQPTAVDAPVANPAGIQIAQNASTGTSTLTFYAGQGGNAQVAAYALDGRKVVGQTTRLETGYHSFELSLPAGLYVIRVSGTGYTYSTKLQGLLGNATKAEIKFPGNNKAEMSALQKSKAAATATTTMSYTAGNQLLYTATSGTFIASVPDIPAESKTTHFVFFSIPTSAIPAGNFTMGSPEGETGRNTLFETQHEVTLTAFRISKYEITNAQYAAFLNAKSVDINGFWDKAPVYNSQILIKPSSGEQDWGLHYSGSQWIPVAGYENYPVINVTWYGATEYATYIGGTLPTEAQWEYACRAGTTTTFNTGACLSNLQANYEWERPYEYCTNTVTISPHTTQRVGSYPSNAYGLYDMHGNVAEWCSDWGDTYPTTEQTNPTGPATGKSRVIRGGPWFSFALLSRSACRLGNAPDIAQSVDGFRVAFAP